jgi:hypothetical protein
MILPQTSQKCNDYCKDAKALRKDFSGGIHAICYNSQICHANPLTEDSEI